MLNKQQSKNLLRTQPKEIKSQFGGSPQGEVVLVDGFWRDRTVDLEIGDILVLHKDTTVEQTPRLSFAGTVDGQKTYRVIGRGYTRALNDDGDWGVNIRIAPKHYEGLARYRFLEDPEEDI